MGFWSCRLFIILVVGIWCPMNIAYGAAQYKVEKNPPESGYEAGQDDEQYKHKAETTQVQTNKQTDLFEKSTGNWQELQQQMNSSKPDLNKSSANNLDFMTEGVMAAAQREAKGLGEIKATDLNSRGNAKLQEWMKETNEDGEEVNSALYVDYSKDLNKQHMKDATSFAEAQDKLLGNLLGTLKELGVECLTKKGLKEVEPKYYLHPETTHYKDTIYNKTPCEELRGKYDCTDSMTMKCEKRSWSVPWEPGLKKMVISLSDVENHGWWYGIHWKKSRYGVHLKGDPNTKKAIRAFVAQKLKVKIDHIHEDIRPEARGNGSPSHNIQHKHYAWGSYNVFYTFRAGEETCDKWSEEKWDERCQ